MAVSPTLPVSSAFVQLPMTTDPTTLADDAIAFLQTQWTDWQPNDGDLEVVLIEALAPMAANAAQIAANMPAAALIAYGTEVLGIPYEQGVAASAVATFTVQDTNGPYDIPSGSEVDIAGVAFQTTQDLVVPNGQTQGTVLISATVVGEFANELNTNQGWSSVNLPVYVTNLSLAAATSGGVDQQDDLDYLNSVAQELQLRAFSVITLPDFEIVAVNTAGIGRAVAIGNGSHPRTITVYVTDPEGNAPAGSIVTALQATLTNAGPGGLRMVNAVVTVSDANYTTVSVTATVQALPGVDTTGLQSSIQAALDLELSPAGWGAPTQGTPGLTWVEQPIVHLYKLVGVISSVQGVDYVESISISSSNIGQLSSALSTGAPITSLPVTALLNAIPNGATLTLTDGVNTQNWTTTSAVAAGATSIPVTSQTPNFAYPLGQAIAGPVAGDLTMPSAAGNLPLAGTMAITVQAASL